MDKNQIITDFCDQTKNEIFSETAKKISAIILSADPGIVTSIKWKKLTYALKNDFHHWICAINFTKNATVLYFHFGGILNDSHNIFITGESRFLRKIEFKSKEDINEKALKDYLKQAISKLDYFKNNWKELNKY